MDNSKKNLYLIILFIITVIYYIPIIKLPVAPFDEGTILLGAERIVKGQFPYKDFSQTYSPGQISTLAVLFKIFGISVTIERVYDLIIKSLLSMSTFIIVRRLSSSKFALLGWAMSLIWIARSSFPAYPMYPFFLTINISVYYMLLHIKHEKNRYAVLSAIFIVLSILFRHDLGVPAAVVFTSVLLLRRINGTQVSWRPLIYFVVTLIAVGMPILAYYVLKSSIKFIIDDLLLIPLAYQKGRVLHYPALSRDSLPFYVFPMVSLTGGITSIFLIKRKTDNTTAYGLLIISLFGIACLNQVRVRSDMIHLLPAALSSFITAPVLIYLLPKIFTLSSRAYRAISIMIVLGFCITFYNSVKFIETLVSRINGYVIEVVNPEIERAKYSVLSSEVKNVVLYIKANTSENDYIYVGVKNHDKFISNDPLIYFLSGRACPSRYQEMSPGAQDTAKIQQEMVNDLKARPPRIVVLDPRWMKEPNVSSIDKNFNIMDDYIADNYEFEKRIGMYEVWLK